MYGKLDENGKFVPAGRKVTREGQKIIIEPFSADELKAKGFKEVFTAEGTGHPGPGMKPVHTFEDKGDFILRRTNWVAKGD